VLCSSDCVLVLFGSFYVSSGLGDHSLEQFNSLSHSGVEGTLDSMKVIMQVLSEANKKGQRLLKGRIAVIRVNSELNYPVGVL
jgi:hypothetical protein